MPRDFSLCLALSALLASGCYLSNAPERPESGARLRAITYEPASGEPIVGGWYDTELDEECSFRRSADGRLRCEPGERTLTTRYLDEGCTEPVFEAAEPGCAPSYVLPGDLVGDLGGEDRCEPSPRRPVHRVGERLEVAQVFQRTSGGGCEAREPMAVVHRLTPVDPSVFVAADEVEEMGAWLAQDRLVAEDGATQPFGLRDTRRGEACVMTGLDPLGGTALSRAPCMPRDADAVFFTGGARCDATWATSLACGADLELVAKENEDACGRTTSVEVFRGTPVPEHELTLGPGCALGFPLTEAVSLEPADDAVPWLTRELRGSGRVPRMVWALGELEAASLPYDAELETTCQPARTADGELRCVPRAASGLGRDPRFVDATCTQRGIAASPFLCRTPWVLSWTSTGCAPPLLLPAPDVEAVSRVGPPAAQGYRLDETGACVAADEVVHALEPVPLSAFARLERRME